MQAHSILAALFLCSFVTHLVCEQELYILGLIPETGIRWTEPYARYSAQLALNHIRENSTILPGYELKIDWQDTMCDGGSGLKTFVDSLANGRSYVAVFGGGCSVATSEVAALAHKYGLAQIAYASTAPNLGDKEKFPRFVRGVPSDVNAVPPRAKFIVDNGWKRVAIINQQNPIFVSSSHSMEIVLGELNVEYRVEDFASDADFPLETSVERLGDNLINNGYRIMIANMYEDAAIKLFCGLLKRPKYRLLLHPHSTWIFLGWFTDNWHNKPEVLEEAGCTAEEVADASNGALGFLVAHSESRFMGTDSDTQTEYGYTVNQLYQMYRDLTLANISNPAQFDSTSDVHDAYVYDSMWSLALALDRSEKQGFNLTEISRSLVFQDERYFVATSNFSQAVYEGMLNFTFSGWSGEIQYEGHERFDSRVQLLEFVNGKLEFRYEFFNIPRNRENYRNLSGIETKGERVGFEFWNDGVADDGIFNFLVNPIIPGLVDVLSLLIVLYITFYIAVIAIGKAQKLQSILNSRAALTCSILGGNYLLLLAGVFYVSNDYIIAGSEGNELISFRSNLTHEAMFTEVCDSPLCTFLCMFPVTLLLTAASIIFGGMIGKASIIYLSAVRLDFQSLKKLNKTMVTAWPYVLASLDLALVLIWSFIAPLVLKKEVISSGVTDPPFYRVLQCQSRNEKELERNVFVGIFIAYKSVLVLIGTAMAYNLRNVKKKSLKYWNTITWTMYNMATYTLVLILCFFLITDHNAKLGVLGFLTLLNVLLTTTITGLPPVYVRFYDPHLNKERVKVSGANSRIVQDMSLLRNRCESLQIDKSDLITQIGDLKVEMERRMSVDTIVTSPTQNGEIYSNGNISNV